VVVAADANPGEARIADVLKARTGQRGGFRSFESVLRFRILGEPFTPENGLLTATLKMRRNVIAERFADRIDEMYAG
jgi:long-chain acyl-CoA synthetase